MNRKQVLTNCKSACIGISAISAVDVAIVSWIDKEIILQMTYNNIIIQTLFFVEYYTAMPPYSHLLCRQPVCISSTVNPPPMAIYVSLADAM